MKDPDAILPERALERLAALCARAEYCEDDIRRKLNAMLMPELISSTILQRFRMSEEIDRDAVLFRVSNRDPEFAKTILREYEEGLRRMESNGVRRRLFDYYGFVPEPLPPPQDR